MSGTDRTAFDVVIRGGRVIDPAAGLDAVLDVGVRGGKIAALTSALPEGARTIDARGKLVLPGLIDTHCHIYEYVTGPFGLNPDQVGIHSGVTTVVDQGGASPLTFLGFRKFVVEPAISRVYGFISIYLAGGLYGHRHTGLYGPHGIDVDVTVKAIESNRDLVRGIKTHAEVGGYSRWGIEVLRLSKEASRAAKVPVYIHLGRLWPDAPGTATDADALIPQILPLLDPGDVIAHPFTRHPGAFVSKEGRVHPLLVEAFNKGIRIDVGHGHHFSFEKARIVLDAGIVPFTLGADLHGNVPRHPGRTAFTHSLHQAMTELLALGVPLKDIVAMVTSNAAVMLGLEDQVGSLAVGRVADVSVVSLDEGAWTLRDRLGVEVKTSRRFRPILALRAGVAYDSSSPLLPELMAEAA